MTDRVLGLCYRHFVEILLFAFFVFCQVNCSIAQEVHTGLPEYSIVQYTDENGLPQNSVKGITADSLGFIWLATEDGLVRFDGHHFVTFDKSNLGIPHNRFYSVEPPHEKSRQRFYAWQGMSAWVKVENGVAQVDSVGEIMSKMPLKGRYGANYRTLISNGLPDRLGKVANPTSYIFAAAREQGKFYICRQGIVELYENSKKVNEIAYNTSALGNFFLIGDQLYHHNETGKIIRFYFNDKKKKYTQEVSIFSGDSTNNVLLKNNPEKISIFSNTTSEQIFILLGNSFYMIDISDKNIINTKLVLEGFDLNKNKISHVYYDESAGRLFMGSLTKGLYVVQKKKFKVIRSGEDEFENVFYGQTIYDSNTILTPIGQKISLSSRKGVFSVSKLNSISEANQHRYSIATDARGFRWVGAGDKVHRFNAEGTQLDLSFNLGREIEQINADQKDSIWVLTKDMGLHMIDLSKPNPKPELFLKLPKGQMCMVQDKNVLWLGTTDGLYKIYIASKKAELVPETKNRYIRSIYMRESGKLWLTTYGDGMYHYQHGMLTRLPVDKNGYLNTAHCIFEDRNGFFWITTNKGLFQASKRDLSDFVSGKGIADPYYYLYTRESGFNINEFNGGCQPCALRLPNGYVTLPSMSGMVWFQPEAIKTEFPEGEILLNLADPDSRKVSIINQEILLKHNPKDIKIELSTPYFGNRENLHLFYTLVKEGNDVSSWNHLHHQKTILLSNLGSGTYSLYIKKINGFGKDNYTVRSVRIIVEKAWYETIWFYLLAAGLGALIIYILLKIQARNLLKRNRNLERAIQDRTHDLRQTLDALEESEYELGQRLRVLSLITTSITHDVKVPIRAVMSVSKEIEKKIHADQLSIVSDIGNAIYETAARIDLLLASRLDYLKLHLNTGEAEFNLINLREVVNRKFQLYQIVAQKNKSSLINEIAPEIEVGINRAIAAVLFNNVIGNAIKFTQNGVVRVHAAVQLNKLHVIVSDTGPGLPAHIMEWINSDAVYTRQDSVGKPENIGEHAFGSNKVGLLIIKQLSAMSGVAMHVEVDSGTHFHLIFEDFNTSGA